VALQAKIKVRIVKKRVITDSEIRDLRIEIRDATVVETTVGRCIFNDMLADEMPFYNMTMSQKELSKVISDCFKFASSHETVDLLDRIKDLGFKYATLAGLSFGIMDLKIPEKKQEIIDDTEDKVSKIWKNYRDGVLTDGERYNQVIDGWTHARVAVTGEMMRGLQRDNKDSELIELYDKCRKKVEEEIWYSDPYDTALKNNFEFKIPGIYFFRDKKTKKVNHGYIGYAGKRAGRGIGGRLKESHYLRSLRNDSLRRAIIRWLGRDPKDEGANDDALEYLKNNLEFSFVSAQDFGPKDLEFVKNALMLDYPEGPTAKDKNKDNLPRFNTKAPKDLLRFNTKAKDEEGIRIKLLKAKHSGDRQGEVFSPYLNPIYVMSDSGARGSVDQIQQLAGMRALMAKPGGEIIETPIKSNFREGLTVLEYFSSTHGARKGLADTALKTANSGYLTRKLIDVAQTVIITERDCGTLQGITKSTVSSDRTGIDVPLSEVIVGRTARDNIRSPITDEMIIRENEVITAEAAAKIESLGIDAIRVRSSLTCDSLFGICAKCYGWDMSTGILVEEGLAVGIVAAQSIGEPGTQLTLRTFHTGGVAERAILERQQLATQAGVVQYRDINAILLVQEDGSKRIVALKRNGEIAILDAKKRELERFKVPYGATVLVKDKKQVKAGTVLFDWDPHRMPILAEVSGTIQFTDVFEGETIRIEEEQKGQVGKAVVIEHKGDKHPQIIVEDTDGKILDVHYLPAGARIEVVEGEGVQAGQLLAAQSRATRGTQDITGGLPRVTEVFEARKPKDPAAMAEISGRVELKSDKRRGKMTIIVRSESGMEKEHHVPRDRHLNVHTGDMAEAGDPLTDGPLVPHDILRIKGEEALQRYLTSEIQNVYRSQNVNINDKHIEIICAQMMRKVEIESVGDSTFLPGEVVDKFQFRRENERLAGSVRITNVGDSPDLGSREAGALNEGQIISKDELSSINEKIEAIGGAPAKGRKPKPATANTLLLGITKASLQSGSFIAAASFQETTKVLTEASLAGSMDKLYGLKENVILGHLIPAGTAFKPHLQMKVKRLAEAPLPKEFAEVKEAKEAEEKAEAAIKEALGID
jgi:DNA-directed RNA polymerase subunit beta'